MIFGPSKITEDIDELLSTDTIQPPSSEPNRVIDPDPEIDCKFTGIQNDPENPGTKIYFFSFTTPGQTCISTVAPLADQASGESGAIITLGAYPDDEPTSYLEGLSYAQDSNTTDLCIKVVKKDKSKPNTTFIFTKGTAK